MSSQPPSPRPHFRWWPLVACLPAYVAAFVATHLPPNHVPGGDWLNDKIKHFIGFLALGIVTAFAVHSARRPVRPAGTPISIWLAMLTYALFDEVTQPFFGRSFEWGDLAADGAGAFFGIGIALFIASIIRR